MASLWTSRLRSNKQKRTSIYHTVNTCPYMSIAEWGQRPNGTSKGAKYNGKISYSRTFG